jgi:mRNA-degrading endonuclease RelE of RelBE toxin-antitoxin system
MYKFYNTEKIKEEKQQLQNQTRKQNYKDHRLIQRAHVKTISKNLINNIDKRPVWRRLQQGGGKTESIAIGDYVFLYDIENKSSIISFSEKEGICFHITFDIPTKEIGIDISFYSSCSKSKPLEKGSGILIILQAILKIIFSRKEINKYNKILITDNSSIECKSYIDGSFVEIRLMDMYYVCTGYTWYSSLAPIFLRDEDDDIKFEKEQQMIAMDLLNKYLDDLKNTEHLADTELNNIEHDQKHILTEMRRVKKELDEIVNENVNENEK